MEVEWCDHLRKCHKCQTYADNVHVPPTPLNVLATPWLFSMWGLDVINPIEPKASNGHRFILVAIDYFTKWVEVPSYASVTENVHSNSAPYRPKTNGIVEAANKNIKKIVQKMVVPYKDGHDIIPFALHDYHTSVYTSTGATPYSMYGMEVVLLIKVEIPSLRVLTKTTLEEAKWIRANYDQLNLIEEKRLTTLCHGQHYQNRMKKAFDKKVYQ
ncbi:hypothetical protein CR513_19491, partial [Mucuna pruriens]